MICSGSSSSRSVLRASAIALLVALSGCFWRGKPAAPPPPLKLAIFPVQNASGGAAPVKPMTDELETLLRAGKLEIVTRQALDVALAQHRIRFTGGVDRPMARVLREELGVDAVLVPTLELYSADEPPRIAMSVRLVSTGERPTVIWADSLARAGNDSPGLLATGLVTNAAKLQSIVVKSVARSVERFVDTREFADDCGDELEPRRAFRAPVLDDVGRRSVAVLPFTNETSRRAASDVVAGQFVAQLTRSGSFEVLDPGFVREQLLSHRIVLQGGVSVDQAMAMLDLLDADLVLSGYVQVYEGRSGRQGPPKAEITAYVIDREAGELVWSSTSTANGDDGVFFFGAGRVHTSSELSCRMVRGVIEGIVGDRPKLSSVE